MWKTRVEIMKNWLYDHCGILQTLGCNYELGHSEACGVIAFIITLLLLVASFLWHKAVVWGYCLISVANRVAEFNISIPIFSLWKWKKKIKDMWILFLEFTKWEWSLKEKNSLYDGTAKIGNQEHFYLKHF